MTRPRLESGVSRTEVQSFTVTPACWVKKSERKTTRNAHYFKLATLVHAGTSVRCLFFLTSRLVRWLAGQRVSRLHQKMLPANKSSWVSIINPIKFPLPKFEKSNEVKDFSLIIPITISYFYLTYNRAMMNIQISKQGKWRRRVIQKMNRGDLSLGTRHILIALCTCAVSSWSPL